MCCFAPLVFPPSAIWENAQDQLILPPQQWFKYSADIQVHAGTKNLNWVQLLTMCGLNLHYRKTISKTSKSATYWPDLFWLTQKTGPGATLNLLNRQGESQNNSWEREKEGERECVCERGGERDREIEHVRERERERERVCVCENGGKRERRR